MVKGVTRRIVVVPSPDPRIFEQAIFIVRDDLISSAGVDSEELLKEAQRVAKSFTSEKGKFISKVPGPVFAAAGAAVTGIAWLAMRLAGVLV